MTTKKTKRAGDFEGFKAWLGQNGAEVLAPTNQYEVIRFRGANGVSVVYRKESGALTFTGISREAFDNYVAGKQVRLSPAKGRSGTSHKNRARNLKIEERDGPECFYCGKPFDDSVPFMSRTREHLVSITHGGPNRVENMFHAHEGCNLKAGHLSAPEKIKLRDKMRAERRVFVAIDFGREDASLFWHVPGVSDTVNQPPMQGAGETNGEETAGESRA